MKIGVPKEIKNQEYRVGMVPAGVNTFVLHGHEVMIETGAGAGSGIEDADYIAAGAYIAPDAQTVYAQAEMIVKVKEPIPPEYELLREGQILFTYLHLACAPELTKALVESGCVAVAYETVQLPDGSLPLLAPMSEVAGRLAIQAGAQWLEKPNGGRGHLLGGVPGTHPAKVVIIGGGVVGINAAKIAAGMGAQVAILDTSLPRLRYLDDVFGGRVTTLASTDFAVRVEITNADLVVGGVLVAGARAPHVVTRDMLETMMDGSVIVDVAVDQGGCVETTHPTTHDEPTYLVDGVIHYAVANMPGCVARTSTFALANATMPYGLRLADLGYKRALLEDEAFRKGLNVMGGMVASRPVADSLGCECSVAEELLAGCAA
ncbi:MAG: alanine dehydrogenase [bacterium]